MLAASLERAAELCDLPSHHLRQAAASGSIPYAKIGVRKIVLLDDVRAWIISHQANKQLESHNA